MEEFRGKVAVITGAGRGIGRGIARRCAREGMKVVLAGVGEESLRDAEAELEGMGCTTLVVRTDVSKEDQVERLARRTVEEFGEVHLLVNNAGVGPLGSVLGSSRADWEWTMGVNFWGMLYGVRAFVPIMIGQADESHVVNVSSISGIFRGAPMFGAYAASKHATVAMTEALYFELAQAAPQVKVSAYCPGQVRTDIADGERNRPPELALTEPLEEAAAASTARLSEQLASAMSPDDSADILFRGLRDNLLYIGVRGFSEQHPWLVDLVRARAESIVQEQNPKSFSG